MLPSSYTMVRPKKFLDLVQHGLNDRVSYITSILKAFHLELTATIARDELVERCKSGDSASYEIIYRQYAKAMYNTSLRIVNNTADAEDVLQEAFLMRFALCMTFITGQLLEHG